MSGYRRPRHRRRLSLTVGGRERISPHFVSITLAGKDFQHLEQVGYDQWGRLFFAGPGQHEVALPSSERWLLQQPGKRRARVRSCSIRRFRPELSAFDIEISVREEHEDPLVAAQRFRHEAGATGGTAEQALADRLMTTYQREEHA